MTAPSFDKLNIELGKHYLDDVGDCLSESVYEAWTAIAAQTLRDALSHFSPEERDALRRQLTTYRGTTFTEADIPVEEPALLKASRRVLVALLKRGVMSWSHEDAEWQAMSLASEM